MSYVCLICRMNWGILALNLKVNKKFSTAVLRMYRAELLCPFFASRTGSSLWGGFSGVSSRCRTCWSSTWPSWCLSGRQMRNWWRLPSWNTRHNILDMNCCVKTMALSSFLDKSLVWWMMLRCADRSMPGLLSIRYYCSPELKTALPDSIINTWTSMGESQIACQLQIHSLRWSKDFQQEKGERMGEEGIKYGEKVVLSGWPVIWGETELNRGKQWMFCKSQKQSLRQ